MTIGQRIKDRREALKMTQEELAQKIGYKSRSSINKIELDLSNLRQTKIKAIADALDTTPAYIMGWDDAPEIEETSESILLRNFRELNEEGQEKVVDYAEDLNSSGRYKKDGKNRMDEKEA